MKRRRYFFDFFTDRIHLHDLPITTSKSGAVSLKIITKEKYIILPKDLLTVYFNVFNQSVINHINGFSQFPRTDLHQKINIILRWI
ncbi:hypothetical protein ASE30_09170 [Achromobacter sp. Root83]|nr:hypothetical protein ASE30_09170 [Achromobacter sp. Root83]